MLSLEEHRRVLTCADEIKEYCTERINKYGLTTPSHGACKGCSYRYRGNNPLMCCIFSDLPYSWK